MQRSTSESHWHEYYVLRLCTSSGAWPRLSTSTAGGAAASAQVHSSSMRYWSKNLTALLLVDSRSFKPSGVDPSCSAWQISDADAAAAAMRGACTRRAAVMAGSSSNIHMRICLWLLRTSESVAPSGSAGKRDLARPFPWISQPSSKTRTHARKTPPHSLRALFAGTNGVVQNSARCAFKFATPGPLCKCAAVQSTRVKSVELKQAHG